MTRAQERAAVIAAKPSRAVRVAKRLKHDAERINLQDFLNIAAGYQALMHQTKEHHEALAAFFDK